ncbi:MAG TPA: COX15/CtaA family protein, partial [Actinomycetota bacterium]|nr:COX15/CtaA family protein [Actinomycetota bacterium]
MNRVRKLAVAATAATGLLIAWGGIVRATGSGDGCPDWPRCFGRWIPPLEYHALIEYVHRLLANLVVPLIAVLAVAAWRLRRGSPRVFRASLAALALVLAQAGLGGVVVLTGLHPWWVTAHFAVAMLVLGALVYATTESRPAAGDAGVDRSFARLAAWDAAAVLALLLVGTYVRARGAGLVFPDWPLMDGRIVPVLEGEAPAVFLHRALAAAVALLALWTVIRALAMPRRARPVVVLSSLLLAMVGAQVLVGAAVVWTRLAAAAVAAHVALSAAIWALAVALAAVARRLAPRPR